MTPRTRQALQEKILDVVKQTHPGTTDSEIAGVAGVDRSLVSRWRNGEREIGLTELVRLQRHYGAVAVLGPIAALDGCEVRSLTPDPAPLRRGSLAVVQAAGGLAADIEAALEDGLITEAEASQLLDAADQLAQRLERLRAAITRRRAA